MKFTSPATLPTMMVQLALCDPHPENYNYHPPAQVEKIRASLRQFGQVKPVVVQERKDDRYTTIAGHGLIEAARAEGWAEIEAKVIPAGWPPAKVKAYLAADNELARQSTRDEAQLASILAEAQAFDQQLLQAIGYNDGEFEALLRSLGEGEAAVKLKSVDHRPPPEMSWVLLGIPTVLYGRIAETIQKLATDPDIIVETTTSNVQQEE